jgi:hypothetical protein
VLREVALDAKAHNVRVQREPGNGDAKGASVLVKADKDKVDREDSAVVKVAADRVNRAEADKVNRDVDVEETDVMEVMDVVDTAVGADEAAGAEEVGAAALTEAGAGEAGAGVLVGA